jgi:hypothetical protein
MMFLTEDKNLYGMVLKGEVLDWAPKDKPHKGGYYRRELHNAKFKLDPPVDTPHMKVADDCKAGRARYYLSDGGWVRCTGDCPPGMGACWKSGDPKPTSVCTPLGLGGDKEKYLYGMKGDPATGRLTWADPSESYRGPYYSRRYYDQPYTE